MRKLFPVRRSGIGSEKRKNGYGGRRARQRVDCGTAALVRIDSPRAPARTVCTRSARSRSPSATLCACAARLSQD